MPVCFPCPPHPPQFDCTDFWRVNSGCLEVVLLLLGVSRLPTSDVIRKRTLPLQKYTGGLWNVCVDLPNLFPYLELVGVAYTWFTGHEHCFYTMSCFQINHRVSEDTSLAFQKIKCWGFSTGPSPVFVNFYNSHQHSDRRCALQVEPGTSDLSSSSARCCCPLTVESPASEVRRPLQGFALATPQSEYRSWPLDFWVLEAWES